MNKRQAKKHKKKMELFVISFCNSYKEVKQLDREYHEYVLYSNKRHKYNQLHGIKENKNNFDF